MFLAARLLRRSNLVGIREVPRGSVPAVLAVVALLATAGACAPSDERSEEHVATSRARVIGGRVSPANENETVFVVNKGDGVLPLLCSGTLIAPNLVLTARHCVFRRRNVDLSCTVDGEPRNPSDLRGQDVEAEAPQNITANYGAEKASFKSMQGVELVTPPDLTICKNDFAFIVLAQSLAPSFVPLRRRIAVIGEKFRFSGWGYTSEADRQGGQPALPSTRFTLDDLRVEEVGPGPTTALGTFTIAGNTLCLGDSGGGAHFNGALGGVYSRIWGDSCEFTAGYNTFMDLGASQALIERAFAAAGQTPWWEGEPAPWLAKDGASCAADAECRSELCTSGACAPSCGTGPACRDGMVCVSGACAAPPPPPPAAPPPADGCSQTPSKTGTPWVTLLSVCAALLVRRRKLAA